MVDPSSLQNLSPSHLDHFLAAGFPQFSGEAATDYSWRDELLYAAAEAGQNLSPPSRAFV